MVRESSLSFSANRFLPLHFYLHSSSKMKTVLKSRPISSKGISSNTAKSVSRSISSSTFASASSSHSSSTTTASSSSSTPLDPFNAFNYRSDDASPHTDSSSNAPLSSWRISIKDNFCTKDMPTTASSKMLSNFTSPFDATAVRRLRKAGARLVGKTNCDEFGMG